MFKKSPLNSTRLKKHKRNMLLVKLIALIILLVLAVLGIAWLTKIQALVITSVSVEGNAAIDASSISSVATNDMVGSYYYLFSRSDRFLYPKNKIASDLLNKYPRLASVHLSVSGHSLVVLVTERAPAYTWCSGTPNNHSNSSCYFMDSDGYIFSQAPQFSNNVFFAFYGLIDPSKAIGSHYLNTATLSSVYDLNSFLDKNSIHAYALLAQSSGEYDVYFGKDSRIIFTSDQSVSDLTTNLDAILKKTTVFSTSATSSNLDYIDMRLGDKIYYKYFGDNS